MSRRVEIDIVGRFDDQITDESKQASKAIDEVGKTAEQAGKKVDNLDKKKAKPDIDAKNDKLIKKLDDSEKKLNKLNRTKASAVLDADDKATHKIKKVLDAGSKFAKKKFNSTIYILDKATKGIANALATAGKWTGKKFKAAVDVADKATKTIDKALGLGKSFGGKVWTATLRVKDLALSPFTALKNTLFSIQGIMTAIASAWAFNKGILEPIGLADAYSSAKIGFQTLLGESEGQQMMDKLDEFAKATPFNASEVIEQTQRMLAMGWDAENIIDDMRTIGDAAAATGKGTQGLQQIVTALALIMLIWASINRVNTVNT